METSDEDLKLKVQQSKLLVAEMLVKRAQDLKRMFESGERKEAEIFIRGAWRVHQKEYLNLLSGNRQSLYKDGGLVATGILSCYFAAAGNFTEMVKAAKEKFEEIKKESGL